MPLERGGDNERDDLDTKLSLEFRLRGLSVGLDGREAVRLVIMLNGELWKFHAGAG